MRRNLRSSLRVRRRSDPMAAYDALPADLRRWLAAARLPWSAQSALRLWNKARARGIDAYELLDRAERATLARDRPI